MSLPNEPKNLPAVSAHSLQPYNSISQSDSTLLVAVTTNGMKRSAYLLKMASPPILCWLKEFSCYNHLLSVLKKQTEGVLQRTARGQATLFSGCLALTFWVFLRYLKSNKQP